MDDNTLIDSELATVYTDTNGYFETTVSNDLSENGYDVYIRLELDDTKAVIKHGLLQSTYCWESTVRNDTIARTLDFGVISPTTTTSEEIEGAFSIWYWINNAYNYYKQNSYNGTSLPKLTIYWQKGEEAGSYYDWLGAMRIAGRNSSGDANSGDHFNPTIILHEYGHFIMDKNNCRPNDDGGTHYFNTPSKPGTAYSEGWASFFALAAKNTTLYKDTETNGWFGADFENVSYYNFGANPSPNNLPKDPISYANNQSYELNVGAVMLDLFDSNNEGLDSITKGFSNVDKIVLSKNNGIYDFYDKWIPSRYATDIKEQTWNVFDSRYVAHDMTVPWASILNVSGGPYTYSGSGSYDDIAIKKNEWMIDRWSKIKTGYGQPDTVSFDPKALGLSTGWHTLSLFCYDAEGLKPSTDRVRFDDFGVVDYSFWVDNTTASSQTTTMSFKAEVSSVSDAVYGGGNDSSTEAAVINEKANGKNIRNIDLHYNELMKRIPETEKLLINQKGILEYRKPVKYVIDVDEAVDLNIYSHIVGPFESLTIYNPNGETVKRCNQAYPEKTICIENAVPGKWQIEVAPPKELTQADEGIPFALIVTSKPSSVALDIPEITNSKNITIEGDINELEALEIKVNGNSQGVGYGNRKFKGQIELQEGLNEISVVKRKGLYKSKGIKKYITLDTTLPDITVFDVDNGSAKTDKRIYTLDGIVSNDTKNVTINGKSVCLGENAKGFVLDVELQDEMNTFEIQAEDYAGNLSKKTINVYKE